MFKKFSEINQFRHTLRNVVSKAQFRGLDGVGELIYDKAAKLPILNYIGTTKLHGTCSSVNLEDGKIICQSREREITPEDDNSGFARFISELPSGFFDKFKSIFGNNIIIHGEYAGKGIQKKVAINEVDKFWAIFRIENSEGKWLDLNKIEFELNYINQFRVFSIFQFGKFELSIDFERPGESINEMNRLTLEVENECPAGKFFGVSGTGEGIVWSPTNEEYHSSKYIHKVKGSKHSDSKVTKLANVDVEKMANIQAYTDKHVNEGRLEQAWKYLQDNKMQLTEASTGAFIKWVFNDVLKEELDELTTSGLTQKNLGGAVAKKARVWFFEKLSKEVPF